jgi:hypothetical protein
MLEERERDFHGRMEQAFQVLLEAVTGEDPLVLRARWGAFEQELLRHLEQEECELRRFSLEHPDEAKVIREQHEQMRTAMIELGVMVDLHLVRADLVNEFLDRLRRHAAEEERLFYPWIRGATNGHHLRRRRAVA